MSRKRNVPWSELDAAIKKLELRFTQTDIANAIGVNDRSIRRWKERTRNPSPENVDLIMSLASATESLPTRDKRLYEPKEKGVSRGTKGKKRKRGIPDFGGNKADYAASYIKKGNFRNTDKTTIETVLGAAGKKYAIRLPNGLRLFAKTKKEFETLRIDDFKMKGLFELTDYARKYYDELGENENHVAVKLYPMQGVRGLWRAKLAQHGFKYTPYIHKHLDILAEIIGSLNMHSPSEKSRDFPFGVYFERD